MDPLTGMAIALLGGHLVNTIGGLFGAKGNRKLEEEENRKNRQWELDMYNRQRGHSLADWNMNNQYNSPFQQMQRLREAGLNPNLIYGKGAENTATMVRSSQGSSNKQNAPQMDYSSLRGLQTLPMEIYQMKQIQAQTDNLHTQNALINAQTTESLTRSATNKFELDQANELRDSVIQQGEKVVFSKKLEKGKRIPK